MIANRIFLSGRAGGDTLRAAHLVGRACGLPVIDLYARVVEKAGFLSPRISAAEDSPAFRALEREAVRELIAGPQSGVVALRSEMVEDRSLRRALLGAGLLVNLLSSGEQLDTGGLLCADADRASAYAECHARIDTSGKTVESVAQEVIQTARDMPIVVPLGERTYRIQVGSGVRTRLTRYVRQACPQGGIAVLVTDSGAERPWAFEARDTLVGAGLGVVFVSLPAGESAKQLRSVEAIWKAALEAGVDRGSIVVGVGGGVVGDLSGFAAATLLRGLALGYVPTTLLAMVDSSIGGKTGFDTEQGKNLIGAFYQPRFVLSDIDTLRGLPVGEVRAGLAEVVKSAWLDGESSVAGLERDAEALLAQDPEATVRAIHMAAELKARVVAEDERESGRRRLLNFGHTIGHAIEASLGFQGIRHGEAVSLGMLAAFRVALGLGRARRDQSERLERLLGSLGLSVNLDDYLSDRTWSFLSSDKKRLSRQIKFVVPADPGQVEVVPLEMEQVIRLVGGQA